MTRTQEMEELWFLMHHSDDPRNLALALTCYCDDSGSHAESEMVVVGATLMNKPRFIEFDADWRKILKEFRIEKVHMQDFVRPNGIHCTMTSEMKKALFTSVAKTINRKKTYSLHAAVPQMEYREFFSKEISRELMGPYAMAFFITVLINRKASEIWKYNNKIAYLVDKGNKGHYEQMDAAHRVVLWLEKARRERSTGAMASDLDDNVSALQAADVVAWIAHRVLENCGDVGDDFEPLLPILKRTQVEFNSRDVATRPHIPFVCRRDAIAFWANLINGWITENGEIPSWEMLMQASEVQSSKNSTIL